MYIVSVQHDVLIYIGLLLLSTSSCRGRSRSMEGTTLDRKSFHGMVHSHTHLYSLRLEQFRHANESNVNTFGMGRKSNTKRQSMQTWREHANPTQTVAQLGIKFFFLINVITKRCHLRTCWISHTKIHWMLNAI